MGLATEAWIIRLNGRGPEFLTHEGLGLANRNALFGLVRVPFGLVAEVVGSTLSQGLFEGRLQGGVGGDKENGDIGGGSRSSDLGVAHAELESGHDLEALMGTMEGEPIYDLYPVGKRFQGMENTRRYYRHFFAEVQKGIRGFTPRSEAIGDQGPIGPEIRF